MDGVAQVKPRKPYKHARVDALVGTAALSSLVFIWLVAVPAFQPSKLAEHGGHVPILSTHVMGGIMMLLSGAVALRIGLTKDWFRWHKLAGYTYLTFGSLASVTALLRSFDSNHTPGLSVGTLSVVWLAFSAMAFRAVRNKQFQQHREWMIRSYVAAWTFVFCRFWSRAAPTPLQGEEGDMIWLTWVAPIFITEIALQWGRGSRRLTRSRSPRS